MDVSYGDVVFRTNDGWLITLHTSYDELKETISVMAPDGRRGSRSNWHAEAVAAGKISGDPTDGLTDAGFDYFERLAVTAPPASPDGLDESTPTSSADQSLAVRSRAPSAAEMQMLRLGLFSGMIGSALYFLGQVLAALSYPGYDWSTQLASELGAVGAASSTVFNLCIGLSGLLTVVSAAAFWRALVQIEAGAIFSPMVALTLVSGGAASLWAASHPLPSAAHNPGFWGAGTVLFPFAFACAVDRVQQSKIVRAYMFGAAVVAMSLFGYVEWAGPSGHAGLLQRLAALTVDPPVLVGAAFLFVRLRSSRFRTAEGRGHAFGGAS